MFVIEEIKDVESKFISLGVFVRTPYKVEYDGLSNSGEYHKIKLSFVSGQDKETKEDYYKNHYVLIHTTDGAKNAKSLGYLGMSNEDIAEIKNKAKVAKDPIAIYKVMAQWLSTKQFIFTTDMEAYEFKAEDGEVKKGETLKIKFPKIVKESKEALEKKVSTMTANYNKELLKRVKEGVTDKYSNTMLDKYTKYLQVVGVLERPEVEETEAVKVTTSNTESNEVENDLPF